MDDLLSPEENELHTELLKKNIAEKKAELELKELAQKELKLNLKQQKLTAKNENELTNEIGPFGTVSEPRKSLSTFFRNQNKMDVSLISIIDRKASILIKICSTTISALIVFREYIDNNVTNGSMISIVLIIGLTITLSLAILATKPFVSRIAKVVKKDIHPSYPALEQNLFVGSQVNCSLAEYETAMQKVIQSQNLQLGNQIRATYLIGKGNKFKSTLVDWAFNAFLGTFIIVTLIYIVSELL